MEFLNGKSELIAQGYGKLEGLASGIAAGAFVDMKQILTLSVPQLFLLSAPARVTLLLYHGGDLAALFPASTASGEMILVVPRSLCHNGMSIDVQTSAGDAFFMVNAMRLWRGKERCEQGIAV
jgi:hypothetical protein